MRAPEAEPDAALQARVNELEELILQARRRQLGDNTDCNDDFDCDDKGEDDLDSGVPRDYDVDPDITTLGIISGELTDHLLAVFCSHIFQFSFYMSVQDFKRSVRLPPSDPNSLPPCLSSAIFLVACHFSPRSLSELEAVFLQRTHRLLSQATVSGDRPMDICMAAVLFSRYCFYTDRFDLGVCYTSSALSFAIGCSLHQISLPSSKLSANTAPLPPSRSEEETLRRIRMWNSLYILDRGSSWTNGLAPYLPDEDITTPWSINSLNSGSRLQQIRNSPPSPTITSLFAADSPTLTVQRGDTALSIRARSVALHDRSIRFVRSVSSAAVFDATFWDTFNSLDSQLSQFFYSLPCLKNDPSTWEIDTYGEDDETFYSDESMESDDILASPPQRRLRHGSREHTVVLAQTCTLAGILQLHGLFSHHDPFHHQVMLDAANDMVNVVRFASFQQSTTHILVTVGWTAAAQVLIEELLAIKAVEQGRSSAIPSLTTASSLSSSTPAHASTIPPLDPRVLRRNLDDILFGLEEVRNFFPRSNAYTDYLNQGLALL